MLRRTHGRSAGVLVLLAVELACSSGTDLAVTTFGADDGSEGPNPVTTSNVTVDPSATTESSAGTGSADDSGGSSDPGTSSGTTGDDCLAEELCDGLDNTCDDVVDEGCTCTPRDTQDCYSGQDGTAGVGLCTTGTQTCTIDGIWGACDGEITPSDETCDGVDDDCDGDIDEGFDSSVCGEGICQVTVDTCSDGVPQRCVPGTPADQESCNGVDDTCDGVIDEGCTCNDGDEQPCYGGPRGTQGIGLCSPGTQTCTSGAWGACSGDVLPTGESCDGLDNDCDMAADEGNPGGGAACATGLAGVCSVGHQQCSNASLSCLQDNQPSAEVCDGFDNDCDTGTDEGNPGGGAGCNTGLAGACSSGTTACSAGALMCNQNVAASTEVCDAVDNDCDGVNNEGNPGGGQACNTGLAGVCGPGTTSCAGGVATCNQIVGASVEICDGLDNDCDTGTDEGNPGGGGACNTGLLGSCATGAQTCSNGALSCTQTVFPVGEACSNGIDEDCDGTADDGCGGGGCSHTECGQGGALISDCSTCATHVCASDPFCCATAWDGICVSEAATTCAAPTCSACAHLPCITGIALVGNCDSGVGGCVAAICAADPFCCDTSWDLTCVGEVATVCGITC